MKYLKFFVLLLALICFFEVYYLHSMLSFIDKPFLYAGIVFLMLFGLIHYKTKKQ
ncbi:MAG: hypothetical protein ACPG7X_00935 [Flavobacteriaceae bacterium]